MPDSIGLDWVPCSHADVLAFVELLDEAESVVQQGVGLGEELHLSATSVCGAGLRLGDLLLHIGLVRTPQAPA